MKLILVAFAILLLLVPACGWETAPGYEPVLTGNVSAKEYSVVAGDWRVTFDTNTSVFTNVVWKESRGLKNGGFYLIWLNASYQVAGIALLELEPGTFASMIRTDLESYLQSFALTDLSKSKALDRKIDGKDGLVAQRWDDKLGLMTYSACYPVDLTSDNTATTIVEFGSFIGEKPSQEIINSIHVERLGAQAIGSSAGHVIPEIVPKGNRYSYDFETLGLDFSTPSGNPMVVSRNCCNFTDALYPTQYLVLVHR